MHGQWMSAESKSSRKIKRPRKRKIEVAVNAESEAGIHRKISLSLSCCLGLNALCLSSKWYIKQIFRQHNVPCVVDSHWCWCRVILVLLLPQAIVSSLLYVYLYIWEMTSVVLSAHTFFGWFPLSRCTFATDATTLRRDHHKHRNQTSTWITKWLPFDYLHNHEDAHESIHALHQRFILQREAYFHECVCVWILRQSQHTTQHAYFKFRSE